MSPPIQEGALTFDFPNNWHVLRPQDSSFYRRHFQSFAGGCKETDLVTLDPAKSELWLIEVKDYRHHPREKMLHVADEIALKVRDVLAMLVAGGANDNATSTLGHLSVCDFWQSSRNAERIRVVLHCELPARPSRLFPLTKDAANLQSKLRGAVRCVDPRAIVMDRSEDARVGWTVS